jgi:hypothetical protein
MALFAIQPVRLAIAAAGLETDAENDNYPLIIGIHQMLDVVIFKSSVIATLYSTDNVAARP